MSFAKLNNQESHTISLLVSNKPGVLLRIALVFSRRAFNIESLVVSPAKDGRFSRMTITASGDLDTLDQINKQAAKLVDVVSVNEHEGLDAVEAELALIKVALTASNKRDLLQLVEHFNAKTIDLAPKSAIIQLCAPSEKINGLLAMLEGFEIIELVRSGKVMMAKGLEKT